MSAPIAASWLGSEQHRNRLLRRADWRFLLPHVNPGKTLCFAGGSIAEGAQAVATSFVRSPGYAEERYDFAVALDPSPEILQKAFAVLRPGGSFYAEWRSWQKRAPDLIRRNLRGAGFQDISLYWPKPDPEVKPAVIWLPLDQPEVLRYYLDHRPPTLNPARRLARCIRRVLWLPRPRWMMASPVASVAIRPRPKTAASGASTTGPEQHSEDESSSGMLAGIQKSWSDWDLGKTPPRQLPMLLITRGLRSSGKAVALVFASGERAPVLAVKMPRIPESTPLLRREATILNELHAQSGTRDGLPRVLAASETSGGYRIVETALRGLPAFVVVTRRNFRDIALRATDWLIRLARGSALGPKSQWWPRLGEPLLRDFREHFGSVVDADMLAECRRALDSVGALPLICEQRDFSPWNVLVDGDGEIAAVDWESAEAEGLPLLDLIYFLTYLCFSLDRARKTGRFLESYRKLRDPHSFTGRMATECMDRYAVEVGLDRSLYRPFRMLTWMLHSRSEYLHLMADVGREPSRDALKQALFPRLWKEEFR